MPNPTLEYPFRPLLTESEISVVYRYINKHFQTSHYHMSLHDALERLLRIAIETERQKQQRD